MFKDKKWWYIIALVVLILLVMFFFKDEVGLSPKEKQTNDRVVEDVAEEPQADKILDISREESKGSAEIIGILRSVSKEGSK